MVLVLIFWIIDIFMVEFGLKSFFVFLKYSLIPGQMYGGFYDAELVGSCFSKACQIMTLLPPCFIVGMIFCSLDDVIGLHQTYIWFWCPHNSSFYLNLWQIVCFSVNKLLVHL